MSEAQEEIIRTRKQILKERDELRKEVEELKQQIAEKDKVVQVLYSVVDRWNIALNEKAIIKPVNNEVDFLGKLFIDTGNVLNMEERK